MNSTICIVSIFINSFISSSDDRVRIQNENHKTDKYLPDKRKRLYILVCIKNICYDIQKENTHNLPKRSRLYQGIIDSKLLPPGVTDFNLLNEVLIVMITPFDLFGYGLYRYTFQMRCEEVPELKLDDGATRIFLNTRGKHPELVSPELIELLKYMEHSTDEISETCKSKRIQEMHRRICQVKASEKTEVKYMQAWEEKLLIKQEGIAEGKQIGVEQINKLNQRLIEQGRFEDLTKATSDKVYQEKLLKEFGI